MKKWLFPLMMIFVLLVPAQTAAGQDAVTLSVLEIDLWPEYDSQEMLVIYRIELSPGVSLPVDLGVQIPASAGNPNAVAVRDPNGALLNAPFEREVNGDWATITLTASMSEIQIEFYDSQLVKNGAERTYTLTWMGDYKTDSLIVQFQQPFDADQVIIFPSPATTTPGSDGLTYYTVDLGSQPAGATPSVSISYQKESDSLSIENLQVQSSAPISGQTSGRVTIMDILPWGLGILGILLVIGGIWWYMQTGSVMPKASRRSRGQRSSGRSNQPRGTRTIQSSPGSGDQGVYCHQCGKRTESGDRFCRSCGTKIRVT